MPRRTLLLDHLRLALAGARRSDERVAVLFIDLDHFKRVNDSLGHTAGDELLVKVAARLRASLREVDTAGRFGGDEFVVVCPSLAAEADALAIAHRVRERLDASFVVRGVEVQVGASIGIAVAGPDADPATVLRHADAAAYRAKEQGRNRLELFDDDLRRTVTERLETEGDLRRALERGELRLHYQPMVDAATGAVVAFESLVRWERPGRGLVVPAGFLPVAEETGLVVALGRAVLRMACEQLAGWQAERGERAPTLSVNLSARELGALDLVVELAHLFEAVDVDPTGLCLEITEGVLLQDTPTTMATLDALRGLGVSLAIDDFGTGYSSLSYLRRLPVAQVKIDGSFVDELDDPASATIVSSVIELSHGLGLQVVAEGVETPVQVSTLAAMGCDLLQGYFFARPGDARQATRLLDHGPFAIPGGQVAAG